MTRPTDPADTPTLVALAERTGVFKPHEIETLQGVLDDYHAVCREEYGHLCFTREADHVVVGFVYLAPTAMTDRTWEVWWIAVDPQLQGRGLGRELLLFAESEAAAAETRLLLIETSSLPHYEPTRRFYLKHGYTVAAEIADFYADGDDKVIFAKRIEAPAEDS